MLLSELVECTIPTVNHIVNDGFWVIMMCQCRFSCNKGTALLEEVDYGEAVRVWE